MKFLSFLLLFFSSIFSEELPPIYNQKALPSLPNGTFHFDTGLIYAKACIDNNSVGFQTQLKQINPGGTSFDYEGSLSDLKFSYEPGFSLQWGFRVDEALGLDLDVSYLRYRSTSSASASSQILLPTISTNGVAQVISIADGTDQFFLSRGDGTWIFGMDLLDAGVRRPFFQGTRLIVSPFVHLRNRWIKQRRYFHFSFADPNGFSQEIKQSNGASARTWVRVWSGLFSDTSLSLPLQKQTSCILGIQS